MRNIVRNMLQGKAPGAFHLNEEKGDVYKDVVVKTSYGQSSRGVYRVNPFSGQGLDPTKNVQFPDELRHEPDLYYVCSLVDAGKFYRVYKRNEIKQISQAEATKVLASQHQAIPAPIKETPAKDRPDTFSKYIKKQDKTTSPKMTATIRKRPTLD